MFSTRSKHIISDEELIEGFNGRNEQAFCQVYERFYNELVYFIRKLMPFDGEEHSRDFIQDLFLAIWESPKQFESLDGLKYYLYFSLKNKWKNFLEHEGYVQRYNHARQEPPVDDRILATMVEAETLALFHRQLNQLPPACSQVIRLGLQGLSGQEIAEEMKISIHTVYSHKQKAIQLLRSLLPKDLFHFLFMWLQRTSLGK